MNCFAIITVQAHTTTCKCVGRKKAAPLKELTHLSKVPFNIEVLSVFDHLHVLSQINLLSPFTHNAEYNTLTKHVLTVCLHI